MDPQLVYDELKDDIHKLTEYGILDVLREWPGR